ncbi:hypothetical protein HaLaN_26787 [Haematococcus lacustris]|uniref:Uncharacterized protein n=1 Tax=Haematococcus lacustris TaxID=44745 RepID=A0A6A0A740_HAELA|nr:hypothetical protein HaLaN_26787 [Haematococcus lacustris]
MGAESQQYGACVRSAMTDQLCQPHCKHQLESIPANSLRRSSTNASDLAGLNQLAEEVTTRNRLMDSHLHIKVKSPV